MRLLHGAGVAVGAARLSVPCYLPLRGEALAEKNDLILLPGGFMKELFEPGGCGLVIQKCLVVGDYAVEWQQVGTHG